MTRHADDDRIGDPTRRTFLRATAGAIALGGVAGAVGAQQEGPQLIVLDGVTAGWEGVAPASIEGETNPTLPLVPGQDYRIRWTNVDGQPHNVVMLDGQGDHVVGTEVIGSQGATQTLEFTANENMAEYYCEVHPSTMRGDVELVEESQLEPVEETGDQTTTPANETADDGNQTDTGGNDTDAGATDATGVDAQGPLGLDNNTQNVSQNDSVPENVQQFRSNREQVFNQTGNGTVRGNLTTGDANATGNVTTTPAGNETANATTEGTTTVPGTETTNATGNETQGAQMGDVSAQDVQQAARVPGFGVVTALGGLVGGAAFLSKRSDD